MRERVEYRSAGFTLVELMVAMVVGIIVAGAMYAVHQTQTRTQITQEVVTEINESRRAVLMIMENEIRTAGADMTGNASAGILTAEIDEFRFTRDVTGPDGWPDGNIDPDEGEDIRYKHHDDNILGRDTVGDDDDNDLHPLLTNVRDINFRYWVYRPQDYDSTDPNAGPEGFVTYDNTVDDLNDISQVTVTIDAESMQSGRGFLRQDVGDFLFSSSIMLRNLPRP